MKILIGPKLKHLRGSQSQASAAKLMEVSQPCWHAWEHDENEPNATTIHDICVKFGCDANWLLGLSDDNKVITHGDKTITQRIGKLKGDAEKITADMGLLIGSIDKIAGTL